MITLQGSFRAEKILYLFSKNIVVLLYYHVTIRSNISILKSLSEIKQINRVQHHTLSRAARQCGSRYDATYIHDRVRFTFEAQRSFLNNLHKISLFKIYNFNI